MLPVAPSVRLEAEVIDAGGESLLELDELRRHRRELLAKNRPPQVAVPGRDPVHIEQKTVDDRSLNRFAIVAPGAGLISSHPIPKGPDGYRWPWATTAPERCSWLLAALESDADVERNNILGYDVIKHDYGDDQRGRFIEVWVAPALDCYELRKVGRLGHPDPSRRPVEMTWDAVSVVEGDPDPEAFSIPEGLNECPPSEIWARAMERMGPLLPSGLTRTRNYREQADERYRELRAGVY